MMGAIFWIALVGAVALMLLQFGANHDAMRTCQIHHSADVCEFTLK